METKRFFPCSTHEQLDFELFSQFHRGPFLVNPSSDGVDHTFEIRSRVTDSRVAATHYWDSGASALMRATVIARSLNRSIAGRWLPPTVRRYFLLDHPSPYTVVQDVCEMQGPLLTMESDNNRSVICFDGDDAESQIIAKTICGVLNERFHRSNSQARSRSLGERFNLRGLR